MPIPQFHFFLLIILTLIASINFRLCSGNDAILCQQTEKQALLRFKHSVKDRFESLSSWKEARRDCCRWEGVVCSNTTGHVLELHLQRSRLTGRLDDSLINLRRLKHLDLSFNDFQGTIPDSIGLFAELEHLDLSNAGFQGTVPHALGNLSSLRSLVLGEYQFSNALHVDSLEWLPGLSRLEHLHFEHVNLTKASNWLQVINTLPFLLELSLVDCGLSSVASLDEVSFSSLLFLNLSVNYFQSIPRWIFQLPKISHLDLSYNSLEGSIPTDVGNLTSLNLLDLSTNDFSGEIPSEIAKLCNMETIDLSHNKLSGDISIVFGNMSNCFVEALQNINFRHNQLSGHLTDQLGEFKNLRSLDLGENLLNGSIPSNTAKLFRLEYLRLDANKFSGNLPESIGQLHNLKHLNIDSNMLEGIVNENHFANLTELKVFAASENHLAFQVSTNWIPSFKLETLELGSWNLGANGQIPTWLHTQKNYIKNLNLGNTEIARVPTWFWNTTFLNLSKNHLYGNIPDIIDGPEFICLSYNLFNGSLPRVNADELDLSNNLFTGGLDHLCDMSNVTYRLRVLYLEENMLSGELPECWTRWPALTIFNLGNNNISGSIPKSIGLLKDLVFFDLFNNSLSGQLPTSMQNCTKLTKIDLCHNHLSGSIPKWLGLHLTSLRIIILRSNKLSGELPSTMCHLNSLQILDMSGNSFSGQIPSCIGNFTAMTVQSTWFPEYKTGESWNFVICHGGHFIETASVAMKGNRFQYGTVLSLVTNIDLSRNNFSGGIPEQLTNLVELRSLNLSGNHLSGVIPDGIGNMKTLESLDLARNSLLGEIPNSMAVLTSLNYLDLSYNNLTGRIPQSTQITSLRASGFIGNALCGPPLAHNCDEPPGLTHEENDDGVGKSEVRWLYVFISLGYVVGLSIVCNVLIFKKPWRDAYFRSIDEMLNKVCMYL